LKRNEKNVKDQILPPASYTNPKRIKDIANAIPQWHNCHGKNKNIETTAERKRI
jgi:hypothetical protein